VPVALRLPEVHSESPVPSLWFCTTSTASSAWRFAGLLHPAADHEVRRVSCSHVPGPPHPTSGWWRAGAVARSPQRYSDPSKDVPRRQPFRVTAVVALLPLACRLNSDNPSAPLPGWLSCRSRTVASASRPCSVFGSVARPRRCRRDHGSVLPWASFPFKVILMVAGAPCSHHPPCHGRETMVRSSVLTPAGHHVAVLPAGRRPPVARRTWDAAPDGPAPGPRARPPKRSRRARSAREPPPKRRLRASNRETVHRSARSWDPIRSESLWRFTRERVYAARHHLAAEAVR